MCGGGVGGAGTGRQEQGVLSQRPHARLQPVKVTIRLIHASLFAGIPPDFGKVEFRLWRKAQSAHYSGAVIRLRPAALIAAISTGLGSPLASPPERACLSVASASWACWSCQAPADSAAPASRAFRRHWCRCCRLLPQSQSGHPWDSEQCCGWRLQGGWARGRCEVTRWCCPELVSPQAAPRCLWRLWERGLAWAACPIACPLA